MGNASWKTASSAARIHGFGGVQGGLLSPRVNGGDYPPAWDSDVGCGELTQRVPLRAKLPQRSECSILNATYTAPRGRSAHGGQTCSTTKPRP
jgi:hypothetical protein